MYYKPIETKDVRHTHNLSKFSKIKGNRPVIDSHVLRLSESIKENGFICNPIIVNEKFEVVDGQHRLEAAKLAGSGVFYIVVPDIGLKEVHALNLNQKNWNKISYMHGYADMGVKSYVELRLFFEKYDFTISTCISLLSNLSADGQFSHCHKIHSTSKKEQVFEEGTWKVRDLYKAYDYAEKITSLSAIAFMSKLFNSSSFVSAISQAMDIDEFIFERFFDKCYKYGEKFIRHNMKVSEYKNAIEDLYNFNCTAKNRVSLKYKYGKR